MYFAIKGIYDKGQIEFLEQVPDIERTEVVVLFESESEIQPNKKNGSPTSFINLQAFGMWKNNKEIKDDIKFAKQLRDQWDRTNE